MIRINLLPARAAQRKEQLLGQLIALVLSTMVVLVGCAGFYVSLQAGIANEKKEIARKQDEINQLRKTIGEVAHYKKLQQELRGKLDVLEKLQDGKTGPVHLLEELSSSLPEKLWITSFKESNGQIKIDGIGFNEESVARFLENLEASTYYGGVELQIIEQSEQGGHKLHKFNLTTRAETPAKKDKS